MSNPADTPFAALLEEDAQQPLADFWSASRRVCSPWPFGDAPRGGYGGLAFSERGRDRARVGDVAAVARGTCRICPPGGEAAGAGGAVVARREAPRGRLRRRQLSPLVRRRVPTAASGRDRPRHRTDRGSPPPCRR